MNEQALFNFLKAHNIMHRLQSKHDFAHLQKFRRMLESYRAIVENALLERLAAEGRLKNE